MICYRPNSYVVDTPGFSSINIDDLGKEDLKYCFIEFERYEGMCRFNGCNHLSEPDCQVKNALEKDEISMSRYKSYNEIYSELQNIRRKW